MTCYQEITCRIAAAIKLRKQAVKTFMLNYRYKACEPDIKKQVADMSVNGRGIRDAARVLKINKNTVISALNKIGQLIEVPAMIALVSMAFFFRKRTYAVR
ncbi:MAG: IS1-like element transposase [Methylobacter sp.]|jgi:hypothetical protein|nr:IS1-like element transposase [Methylobacter sp.]